MENSDYFYNKIDSGFRIIEDMEEEVIAEKTEAEMDAEEEEYVESFDELTRFRCIETEDKEVEKEFWYREWVRPYPGCLQWRLFKMVDDSTSISCPYFTQSGDYPSVEDAAFLNDQHNRLMFDMEAPEKEFYSTARPYHAQFKNYLQWQYLIWKHQNNKTNLLKLWTGFWAAYFRRKTKERSQWMYSKHVTNIIGTFRKYFYELNKCNP